MEKSEDGKDEKEQGVFGKLSWETRKKPDETGGRS